MPSFGKPSSVDCEVIIVAGSCVDGGIKCRSREQIEQFFSRVRSYGRQDEVVNNARPLTPDIIGATSVYALVLSRPVTLFPFNRWPRPSHRVHRLTKSHPRLIFYLLRPVDFLGTIHFFRDDCCHWATRGFFPSSVYNQPTTIGWSISLCSSHTWCIERQLTKVKFRS
jgi:hypothetical protein